MRIAAAGQQQLLAAEGQQGMPTVCRQGPGSQRPAGVGAGNHLSVGIEPQPEKMGGVGALGHCQQAAAIRQCLRGACAIQETTL